MDGLVEMLVQIDILVCLLLLMVEMCGLLDVVWLVLLFFQVQFINFVCGLIINDEVLCEVLDVGRLCYVVLDVFVIEFLLLEVWFWLYFVVMVLLYCLVLIDLGIVLVIVVVNICCYCNIGEIVVNVDFKCGY